MILKNIVGNVIDTGMKLEIQKLGSLYLSYR